MKTLKVTAELVNFAFSKICRMKLAQLGFECTGIYQLNQNVFSDLDAVGLLISSALITEERPQTHFQTLANPDQEELHWSTGVSNLLDMSGTDSDHPADQSQMLNQPTKVEPSHIQNLLESLNQTCDQCLEVPTLMLQNTLEIFAQISPLSSTLCVKFRIREYRCEKHET